MKPGGESYNETGFFRDLSGIILRALGTGAGMSALSLILSPGEWFVSSPDSTS